MTAPRVEVGGVRLDVCGVGGSSVRVKNEFVRREEKSAKGAFNALCAGGVVPGGEECTPAPPGALVVHRKSKVVGKSWRCVVP